MDLCITMFQYIERNLKDEQYFIGRTCWSTVPTCRGQRRVLKTLLHFTKSFYFNFYKNILYIIVFQKNITQTFFFTIFL